MSTAEKKTTEKFDFDLEKKIKENPKFGTDLLDNVGKRVQEVKKKLRETSDEKQHDPLGILLHGYAALQKVLKKIHK